MCVASSGISCVQILLKIYQTIYKLSRIDRHIRADRKDKHTHARTPQTHRNTHTHTRTPQTHTHTHTHTQVKQRTFLYLERKWNKMNQAVLWKINDIG